MYTCMHVKYDPDHTCTVKTHYQQQQGTPYEFILTVYSIYVVGWLLTIGEAVLSGIGKGFSLSSPATLSVALDGGPA